MTFAGTSINALPIELESTVSMPSSGASPVSATVTISPSAGGTMPVSPPIALGAVRVTEIQTWLDIYRSPTNSAVDIIGPAGKAPGSRTLSNSPGLQAAGSPWVLGDAGAEDIAFSVQVPITGSAGDRVWARVKSLTYVFSSADYTGSTFCRLAGTPAGDAVTVLDPIAGSLSDFSAQYPESATALNLGLGETALRRELAGRVTITGSTSPPTGSSCTVTDTRGCVTGQQVTATVIAGSLTQAATRADSNPSSTVIVLTKDDGITATYSGLPAVTVGVAPQVLEGALNPVTVTDVRGGAAGWSLTAALSGPFTEVGTGQISESAASLAPTCTELEGSATQSPGSGGVLSNAVTLCGVDPGIDDSIGQSGGGQYTVRGRLTVTVPPFQKAGEYSSTLVITLT
jgi:hypothetical protein